MAPRVGLIAALDREIAPLVGSFTRRHDSAAGLFYERPNVWMVCGGIGGRFAATAARWVIASFKPEVVMSIGFAGALVPDCKVGDVITPGTVIEDSTGEVFSVGSGRGVLVSATGVVAE